LSVEVVRRPGLLRVLSINPQYRPLADVRVRQALAFAINKKELELASGGQMVATSHLLPNLPWLQQAAMAGRFPVYNNDPAHAKKLLADAGQAQLKVTLLFQMESPSPIIAQVLAEQFRRVGIDVTLDGLEQRAWGDRQRNAQFQVTTLGIGRGADPDEMARELLHTSNFPPGNNSFRYDRADALIAAGARERDPAKRQQIYIDLMKQVLADLPYIPLVNDNLIAAWRAPIRKMVTGIDNDFPAFTIEVTR
jgi:peptide/nickel transport system substrate-binding protein